MVEVIAVLVIMGVMASVAVHRVGAFNFNAEQTALQGAIHELNVRESLVWVNSKLVSYEWDGDPAIWALMDTDLGGGYRWNPAPTSGGGTLYFGSQSVHLTRTGATISDAAKWH